MRFDYKFKIKYNKYMKRIICILLTILMCVGLVSCGKTRNVGRGHSGEFEGKMLSTDDPIYSEVADMLVPVEKFVEYNHILGNSIDYADVPAEEFWNIVAIAVSSYEKIEQIANIDVAGVYHLSWDNMLEFAKTFLYESWYKNNTPSYKESYSASADPGSGVIDLIPLDVNNFNSGLESITEVFDSTNCKYVLNIALSTKTDNPTVYHYEVYLADWHDYLKENFDVEDDGGHIMPYIVVGYKYIGSDEPKN